MVSDEDWEITSSLAQCLRLALKTNMSYIYQNGNGTEMELEILKLNIMTLDILDRSVVKPEMGE